MIFSWLQAGVFMTALGAVGWLIYPDEYMQGRMYRDEGDRSVSIGLFKSYLRSHPAHKGATLGLIGALEAAGRPDEAVEPLLDFYMRRPGDPESGHAALSLLQRTQQLDRADGFRWRLITDLRSRPTPGGRKLEEVVFDALQRAVDAQDDERALQAMAILSRSADGAYYREQTIRLLLSRGLLDRALPLIRDDLRLDPRNADLYRSIARILRAKGNAGGAASVIDDGLAALPFNAGLLSDRADIAMHQRRWAAAEADLRALMRIEPKQDAWPKDLAHCLIESGRLEEGVRMLELVLARAPYDPSRWWDLVYVYSDRRMHAEAAERLTRLLERFPEDSAAFDALLNERKEMGRPDLAIAQLEDRLAGHPGDAERRRALVYLLVDEERQKDAIPHIDALLETAPADPEMWVQAAYLRETTGDLSGAAAVTERYLERYPEDAHTLEKLAWLYDSMGNRRRAIELLRSYFRGEPPPKAAR